MISIAYHLYNDSRLESNHQSQYYSFHQTETDLSVSKDAHY